MTRPVRTAAIGLGWVAQNRHLPVMERSRRYAVVGVIDREDGRARTVAGRRGYPRHACATKLMEVPWIDEVDAVTIATSPMSHYPLVEEALALGKHVLTEKPFTMTLDQGESLVRAAASANRCLGIVHNFQFSRSIQRLRRDIGKGHLGAISGIDAIQFGNPARRLPAWYDELPLGLFYDESPHLLYLIRSIAGELRVVHALTAPSRTGLSTPARVEAWFQADSCDYTIKLSCNFESPLSEWYLIVFGERRIGIVDIFRDIYVSLPNDGAHDARRVVRTSIVATSQHWIQHIASGIPHLTGRLLYGNDIVFDRFARAIGGEADALAPIGPDSALAVLKLQHAIIERQESIYSG